MKAKHPASSIQHLAPSDADAWFTPLRFAGILAVLIVVCFPSAVTGFETFFFRDFGSFGYPLAFFHRESFWRGEIPLWNPANTGGLPFLAQWNTLTLYPLSLIYLIFPLSWSLGIFNLAHLWLAGMGMYFLAYRWTNNRLAAAIAAAAFAFNGLTWHALMWPNNIAALGWMPWVVLAMEKAWNPSVESGSQRHPPSSILHPRPIILASFTGAMQMLAGAPEIIILTWFLLVVLWLVEMVRGELPRGQLFARFVCIGCLVAALAAAQLLPFLDLLAHSERNADYGGSQWAMPLSGWANYLAPLFHSFPQKGVFSQYDQFWTSSYYVGIGTIAFAVLALWRARIRRTWLLAALTIFSLLMAMGDNLGIYSALKKLFPFMGFLRYPIKFVVLATFAIPLLAAHGIVWIQSLPEEKWPLERRKLIQTGILLFVMTLLIGWWEWIYPRNQDDHAAVLENIFVRTIFLALILGCVMCLPRIREFKLQRLLRVALIMLFWFDVFTHTPNLSPTVERSVYEPDTIRQFFKWDKQLLPGESRAMETPAALAKIMLNSVAEPSADVNGRRLALFANYNLLDHASKLDGLYSLNLREIAELNSRLYSASNVSPRLLDFLCVAQISNPTNAVDWVSRPAFLPLITAGQEPVFAENDFALRAVMSAAFEPNQTVYLEPAAQPHITAHRTIVKITSRQFDAQHASAEMEASAPAMIVVAQAFYHNWHAYVDGNPAPLLRGNYAFQALEIPAGHHQIKLAYEDAAFKYGAIISLATLAVIAIIWLCSKRPPIANK